MLVEIENTAQLEEMNRLTGIPVETLVNEILGIHLDKQKKDEFLKQEIDRLFELYKNKHHPA